MLDINPSKIEQIVVLGHEVERAEAELRGFISALNEEECHSLIAVMWIGRETFMPDDYDEALETARQEATTATADYLIGTPHFPDHLEAGLELLGISPEEI